MTLLRIKIVGEDAHRPHNITVTDVATGDELLDVQSFDLRAHVTEGVTCTLHRITMKLDPATNDIGRFDTEADVAELDIEAHESE